MPSFFLFFRAALHTPLLTPIDLELHPHSETSGGITLKLPAEEKKNLFISLKNADAPRGGWSEALGKC